MTIHPQTLINGVKQLSNYEPYCRIIRLAGSSQSGVRAHLMAILLDVPKIAKAKAGVTAIEAEFYRQANIQADTLRGKEVAFANVCKAILGKELL